MTQSKLHDHHSIPYHLKPADTQTEQNLGISLLLRGGKFICLWLDGKGKILLFRYFSDKNSFRVSEEITTVKDEKQEIWSY